MDNLYPQFRGMIHIP